MVSTEDGRIRMLLHDAVRIYQPEVLPYRGALPTVVLTAGSHVYTAADLVQYGALVMLPNHAALLLDNIFVSTNARITHAECPLPGQHERRFRLDHASWWRVDKEGTTGGKIIGNQFDGTGMVESAATGWINVKGNGWTIEGNTGVNSVKNGFQVHQVYPGWGIGNIFTGNRAQVNGPGYGFYVQSKDLQTVVACNNVVSAAGSGFSTVTCSSA